MRHVRLPFATTLLLAAICGSLAACAKSSPPAATLSNSSNPAKAGAAVSGVLPLGTSKGTIYWQQPVDNMPDGSGLTRPFHGEIAGHQVTGSATLGAGLDVCKDYPSEYIFDGDLGGISFSVNSWLCPPIPTGQSPGALAPEPRSAHPDTLSGTIGGLPIHGTAHVTYTGPYQEDQKVRLTGTIGQYAVTITFEVPWPYQTPETTAATLQVTPL